MKDAAAQFVTNITNYIRGEKIVEKFQLSIYDNCREMWRKIEPKSTFVEKQAQKLVQVDALDLSL